MKVTTALYAAGRVPLIKFIGKRTPPKTIDHTPTAHPASPSHSLPDSFANYRSNAQQHGPLGSQGSAQSSKSSPSSSSSAPASVPSSSHAYGAIGGHSGHSLGKIDAPEGMYFDRSELPKRFRRTAWSQAEIDAIETGGASMWG
ncbi:hypothetical protein MMC32_006627 [Xylographa parallela]|nr:hypothetical protein [Xylographa parallela]